MFIEFVDKLSLFGFKSFSFAKKRDQMFCTYSYICILTFFTGRILDNFSAHVLVEVMYICKVKKILHPTCGNTMQSVTLRGPSYQIGFALKWYQAGLLYLKKLS